MTLNRSATPSGPRLAYLFTLSAVIGGSDDAGQSSLGRRLRDSAGEGTFSGACLRGEVLPGRLAAGALGCDKRRRCQGHASSRRWRRWIWRSYSSGRRTG
jgi:hypothetical protein